MWRPDQSWFVHECGPLLWNVITARYWFPNAIHGCLPFRGLCVFLPGKGAVWFSRTSLLMLCGSPFCLIVNPVMQICRTQLEEVDYRQLRTCTLPCSLHWRRWASPHSVWVAEETNKNHIKTKGNLAVGRKLVQFSLEGREEFAVGVWLTVSTGPLLQFRALTYANVVIAGFDLLAAFHPCLSAAVFFTLLKLLSIFKSNAINLPESPVLRFKWHCKPFPIGSCLILPAADVLCPWERSSCLSAHYCFLI